MSPSIPSFTIAALFISPGHNYFGHHGKEQGEHPILEVDEIECVAGRGIRNDRFFDFKPDYKGQITFFAWEVYARTCAELGLRDKGPGLFRRNVITRGVDLNNLVGREFEVQGVRFSGTSECAPCYWMDHAFAPGMEKLLEGNGGLRCRILSDGWLRRVIH